MVITHIKTLSNAKSFSIRKCTSSRLAPSALLTLHLKFVLFAGLPLIVRLVCILTGYTQDWITSYTRTVAPSLTLLQSFIEISALKSVAFKCILQFGSFCIRSASLSAISIKSPAHSNSHYKPPHVYLLIIPITMINRHGPSRDPWCRPNNTLNHSVRLSLLFHSLSLLFQSTIPPRLPYSEPTDHLPSPGQKMQFPIFSSKFLLDMSGCKWQWQWHLPCFNPIPNCAWSIFICSPILCSSNQIIVMPALAAQFLYTNHITVNHLVLCKLELWRIFAIFWYFPLFHINA